METTITRPSSDILHVITEIRIYFSDSKNMNASVIGDGGELVRVGFNVQPLLDQMTSTQKTLIRQWYKRLAVLALNQFFTDRNYSVTVTEEDIIGDSLED